MIIPKYKILRSSLEEKALAERDILQQVAQSCLAPIRVLFFTDTTDAAEYCAQRARIKGYCQELFLDHAPVTALVVQPPLVGGIAAEATYAEQECDIKYHDDYIVIEGTQIYTAGLYAPLDKSIEEQSEIIFRKLTDILTSEGFAINDIVRQWNYLEHITRISAQGQNYQQFNDARSRFYGLTEWQNGYPAATGIGTGGGGVVVVADAVKQSASHSLKIDNPQQQSAHAYSQQVLIDGSNPHRKTTPKFERARWVGSTVAGMIYISGTAAIRGEESLREDVVRQSEMTMDNIKHLISTQNQVLHAIPNPTEYSFETLRIYVKHNDDWQAVNSWIKDNYPKEDTLIVEADICREELLVEIEGIAKH